MILKKLFENTEPSLDDITNMILSDGMDFIRETTGFLFFSGRRNPNDYFLGQYRTDRRPLTTSEGFQIAYDKMLSEKGITSLRSNSLFITSNYSTANTYGNPFVIFPLGKYDYHFTDYSDTMRYYNKLNSGTSYNLFKLADFYNITLKELVIACYKSGVYQIIYPIRTLITTENMSEEEAIEQILKTDKDSDLWRLSISGEDWEEVAEKLNIKTFPYDYGIEQNFKILKLKHNKDLDIPAKNGYEVLVNSTKGYVAIRPEDFIIKVYPKLNNITFATYPFDTRLDILPKMYDIISEYITSDIIIESIKSSNSEYYVKDKLSTKIWYNLIMSIEHKNDILYGILIKHYNNGKYIEEMIYGLSKYLDNNVIFRQRMANQIKGLSYDTMRQELQDDIKEYFPNIDGGA